MKKKRTVAVVLVDRANYGRVKPVMQEIQASDALELLVISAGSMVLNRFGRPVEKVIKDGFEVHEELYVEVEGGTPSTMATSVGLGVIQFSAALERLKPDLLFITGDRFEALAATVAGAMSNITIAHMQGGEVSGSIDESIRHSITKFAQYHFPATKRAEDFIKRMGEDSRRVFCVGCPAGDLAMQINGVLSNDILESTGSGAHLKLDEGYFLVAHHPMTTDLEEGEREVKFLLDIFDKRQQQTLWLWPNIDAGSDRISKMLRTYSEKPSVKHWLHLAKNFTPDDYLLLLKNAKCAIGNSSSFVRDSSFFGTPVVLVGNRQNGRECASNVRRVKCDVGEIEAAIDYHMAIKRYPKSSLYGDGNAAKRIVEKLAEIELVVQKSLSYLAEYNQQPN